MGEEHFLIWQTKKLLERASMKLLPLVTHKTTGLRVQNLGDRAPHGRLLRFARVVCIAVAVLALGLFVGTLPTYFAQLHTLCTLPSCSFGQLSASEAETLSLIGLSLHGYAILVLGLVASAAFACALVAALLFFRASRNWMALLVAVLLVLLGTSNSTTDASVLQPCLGPALAVPVAHISNYLGAIALPLILSLFPNGRLIPRWIGFLLLAMLISGVVFTFPFSPPVGVVLLSTFLWVAGMLILVGAQIYRYRRMSTPVERRQTRWVIFGFTGALFLALFLLLPVLLFPLLRLPSSPYYTLWTLLASFILTLPIALSFGLATLRYRLWDIDLLINRTLVYGVLMLSIVCIYAACIVSLSLLLQAQGNPVISLIAAGLIAVLFQPIRERLQHLVNRLMYGERDDPYLVLSRLGQRLEATLAPDAVLSVIVETIAQALKLPYVAITLQQDQASAVAAFYGEVGEQVIHLPLLYQSEQVGELLLTSRARGESFTPADHRLLSDLARQVGIAVHAIRLTADVQQSRERLVTAREEERRRLRRDLHDGLGPSLASMTLKLDAARNLLTYDPVAADALLIDLKKQTRASLGDIRRLVYELRPPSLDELGLVQALREQAEQYLQDSLHITLDAPDTLPLLPAAVEVAAYRIVQEALTNVVRHAQAHTCTIRFTLNCGLEIEVCDDGRGIPVGQRAGVGLTSIRERAAELAGVCEIESMSTVGTRLHVRLPLPETIEREE